MPANQLLALAHGMNLLSLPNVLELAHSNLQAIMESSWMGQFVLVNC